MDATDITRPEDNIHSDPSQLPQIGLSIGLFCHIPDAVVCVSLAQCPKLNQLSWVV